MPMPLAAILPDLAGPMQNSPRRVAFNERNHCFLRSSYCAPYDPTAPRDAQAETPDGQTSIPEGLPLLRIDHIATKSPMLGVRQTVMRLTSRHHSLAIEINGDSSQTLRPIPDGGMRLL